MSQSITKPFLIFNLLSKFQLESYTATIKKGGKKLKFKITVKKDTVVVLYFLVKPYCAFEGVFGKNDMNINKIFDIRDVVSFLSLNGRSALVVYRFLRHAMHAELVRA